MRYEPMAYTLLPKSSQSNIRSFTVLARASRNAAPYSPIITLPLSEGLAAVTWEPSHNMAKSDIKQAAGYQLPEYSGLYGEPVAWEPSLNLAKSDIK
jgi:hypothetical protein